MRLRLRSFLLTSALTFAPAVASATTISGLYVDGGAGYNLVQDQHVHANSPANGDALPKFSVNHGTGYTGFGAIGYGFGNGLRVEAEGLYNFSHDDYTSEASTLGYTNNPTHAIGFNHFYKTPTDSQRIPCTSADLTPEDKDHGIQPFWSVGSNSEYVGTGDPATSSGYTTVSSYTYPYIPANLCFLVPNTDPMSGDLWNTQLAEAANNGYTDGIYEKNNTMYTPGVYYYQGDININSLPYYGGVYGLTVQPGHPLYLARIERLVNHQGTDESWGGFANVLYDFDLERLFGLKSIVTPFIGGGAGYLWQRYNRPNTMIAAITGTHGGFSWQGIAGVAFDTGISGLQVVAQYRMIGQPGSFYNGTFNYGTEGGHANFDQRFNHQFIVGFRYAFH
ncbi:MAG: hypothetical protein IIT54_00235, partial [Acetobacter sp.]|nr:hypothetical protein [Acetobacter sp.]